MKRETKVKQTESHLKVFTDRSVLVSSEKEETFNEGSPDPETKVRLANIKKKLSEGWLKKFIKNTVDSPSSIPSFNDHYRILINKLVDSVTSEVGRAIVGLTILQLTVKCIEPKQNIRLHKGGSGDFSWTKGLPMRGLDAQFITPTLREFELLRLNAYGFMMTRSLAENYPYSKFYKAAIKGGKPEWLELVDALEDRKVEAEPCLAYLVSLLSNRSIKFKDLAAETTKLSKEYAKSNPTLSQVYEVIFDHVSKTSYSPRLLEVAMHSLLQVAEDNHSLDGFLVPLCQMRTANKKHRNVGDIEIVSGQGTRIVIEAWDAKFGKPYLRDELEELDEKLATNQNVELAGFVTDSKPTITRDIEHRVSELKTKHQLDIRLLSFQQWVNDIILRIDLDHNKVAQMWIIAYTESLCQERRDRAPIDEPSEDWVESLKVILTKRVRR